MGIVNTLSVVTLLGCCAAMVSASSRAHRTSRHHSQQQVRHETITVVKKGEPELRQEIHEILEKLFIPTEHPGNDPRSAIYRSPDGRLLPSGERQDYIVDNVITYAFYYLRGLQVSGGPKINGMNGAFWNRNSFPLRAHNFGWDHLPLPQQYLEMTRTLLKLVELVESAFGESSEFREDESRRQKHNRSYSLAGVKEDLQQAIKEICEFYHIDDVQQPGLPSSNPPPMGHPGEEPQPAAPTPASFDGAAVASFMEQLHGVLSRFGEAFFAKLKERLDKVQVARDPPRPYEKPYQGGMEW